MQQWYLHYTHAFNYPALNLHIAQGLLSLDSRHGWNVEEQQLIQLNEKLFPEIQFNFAITFTHVALGKPTNREYF